MHKLKCITTLFSCWWYFANPSESLKQSNLTIRVLNPVHKQDVTVEIEGASAQVLQVRLVEPKGTTIYEQSVPSAGVLERHLVPIRSPLRGLFLVQASSLRRAGAVKVLRP